MVNFFRQCRILTGIIALFYLLGGVSPAKAEEIRFSVEISNNQVSLGQAVQLTITINGVTNLGEINLPQFDNFDVQYLGPSTHVSIVNGKYYSSKSFTYSLLPQKTGRFVIQSLNVTINGKNYSTAPISIDVIDPATQLTSQSQDYQTSLKDKINLILRVPKKEVYINEGLPVKVMLLVSNLSVRDIRYPEIKSIGFMVGNFEQPKQYQQIINGVRYDIVEFDAMVYPTRTGDLTLGPAHMESNLLVKGIPQQSTGSLFNDAFFNAFFDRNEKRPITLESEPVTITVKNLPDEGKPENFSGAVGDFDFDMSVSPTELKVGDPITVRMGVKGRGNLKSIELPEFADTAAFKIYKPNIKDENNVKTLEQVIIPLTDKVTEVPPQEFSFFDPQLNKYRTITKGPYPLTVRPLEEGESMSAVGLEQPQPSAPQEEKIGEDIVFIKNNLGQLHPVDPRFRISLWYTVVMFLGLLLWIVGIIHFKWTHRLATDQAFARRLRAPKEARKQLNEAKTFLLDGEEGQFYDHLYKSLQNYLSHRFLIPPGQISAATIREKLNHHKSHEKNLELIERIFSECESVRYASVHVPLEQMRESYHDVEKVIDYFERHVK